MGWDLLQGSSLHEDNKAPASSAKAVLNSILQNIKLKGQNPAVNISIQSQDLILCTFDSAPWLVHFSVICSVDADLIEKKKMDTWFILDLVLQ